MPPDRWPDLYDAFVDLSNTRLLMTWFRDPAAQAIVADAPIGGALRDDPGDHVYVVEANVAPTSKYNLVVDRHDQLTVRLDASGNASSHLAMAWDNRAMSEGEPYRSIREYSTSAVGLYGSFVRVLASDRSELVSAEGMALNEVTSAETNEIELGRSAFGNLVLIPAGSARLEYVWTSPAVATRSGATWTYQLTIQKQPGLRPMPVSVSVHLPDGAQVSSVSAGASAADGVVTYAGTPEQDVQIRVAYQLP